MESYKFRIFGRVQGVTFRASTRKKANQIGVNGWVRNEPDGSVTAVARGDRTALREFEDWCHRGPTHARVKEVKKEKIDEAESYSTFEIRR